jgi:hypothetical protein
MGLALNGVGHQVLLLILLMLLLVLVVALFLAALPEVVVAE